MNSQSKATSLFVFSKRNQQTLATHIANTIDAQ